MKTLMQVKAEAEKAARPNQNGANTKRLQELERRLTALHAKHDGMFELEKDTKTKLGEKIAGFEKEKTRLTLPDKYPHLDPAVLAWRDEKGFPKFALFHLDDDETYISSKKGIPYPESLKKYYTDVYDRLVGKVEKKKTASIFAGLSICIASIAGVSMAITYYGLGHFDPFSLVPGLIVGMFLGLFGILTTQSILGDTVEISARYNGAIPDATRAKIKLAEKDFGLQNIFILSDVSWVQKTTYTDPLVIGLKDGNLWLIDAFETTPSEEYIAQEFTTSS